MSSAPEVRFCQDTAEQHHDPAIAPEASRHIVTLVHAADIICNAGEIGFNLTTRGIPLDDAITRQTIPTEAIKQVTLNLRSLITPALALFS